MLMGGVQLWVREVRAQSMGKDFCLNFLPPFLENTDRRSYNDGGRELIPVFHNPHRKGRPSPSAVARTLEYRVGGPSKAATRWRYLHPRDP